MRQLVQQGGRLPVVFKRLEEVGNVWQCYHSRARKHVPTKTNAIPVLNLGPLLDGQPRAPARDLRFLPAL
jgi:hypothetical protein